MKNSNVHTVNDSCDSRFHPKKKKNDTGKQTTPNTKSTTLNTGSYHRYRYDLGPDDSPICGTTIRNASDDNNRASFLQLKGGGMSGLMSAMCLEELVPFEKFIPTNYTPGSELVLSPGDASSWHKLKYSWIWDGNFSQTLQSRQISQIAFVGYGMGARDAAAIINALNNPGASSQPTNNAASSQLDNAVTASESLQEPDSTKSLQPDSTKKSTAESSQADSTKKAIVKSLRFSNANIAGNARDDNFYQFLIALENSSVAHVAITQDENLGPAGVANIIHTLKRNPFMKTLTFIDVGLVDLLFNAAPNTVIRDYLYPPEEIICSAFQELSDSHEDHLVEGVRIIIGSTGSGIFNETNIRGLKGYAGRTRWAMSEEKGSLENGYRYFEFVLRSYYSPRE